MKQSTLNLIAGVAILFVMVFGFGMIINLFDGTSLKTPTIAIVDSSDNTISITEVRGADGYEVYADGVSIGTTKKTEFSFNDLYYYFAGEASGIFEVTVKAYGSSFGDKVYSEQSDSVRCTIVAD